MSIVASGFLYLNMVEYDINAWSKTRLGMVQNQARGWPLIFQRFFVDADLEAWYDLHHDENTVGVWKTIHRGNLAVDIVVAIMGIIFTALLSEYIIRRRERSK